jgi:DNA-binding HxlR family transcriptional regulator
MGTYGQFCPVAKALEVLDERWTLLVVRELLAGSTKFNELRRGVPRMSPTLLTKRLQRLVGAGLVERHTDGRRVSYSLTTAGEELRPVVEAVGTWGVRWAPELGDEDLDPHLLMWDIHRNVDSATLPAGRTTVEFRFGDVPVNVHRWWLVMTPDGDTEVCDANPGLPVSALVDTQLECLVRVWRGDLGWREAMASGRLTITGPRHRSVPRWLTLSDFAPVPRR